MSMNDKFEDKRYHYITPEDWNTAERNDLNRKTVYYRVAYLGWDIDKAVNTPAGVRKLMLTESEKQAVAENDLKMNTVHWRIRNGWTREAAVSTPAMSLAQIAEKARSKRLDFFTKEQLEIARRNGLLYNTIFVRVKKLGWSVEDAVNTPTLTLDQVLTRARAKSPFRQMNDIHFRSRRSRLS